MAAFLYRMAGSPEFDAPSTSPFTDVSESSEFYKENLLAGRSGYLDGLG